MVIVTIPVTRRRLDMDLKVILFTLFLLGVVFLPALKAEVIDSPTMDWFEEEGLPRILEKDDEMKSDDYDRIVDKPTDIEDDTDDFTEDYTDYDDTEGEEDDSTEDTDDFSGAGVRIAFEPQEE